VSETRRRSNTSANGWIAVEVAKRTGHAFVEIAELAAAIYRDTHDDDDDFSTTEAALHRLEQIAVYGCDTQWDVADGDYTSARESSKRLVEKPADNTPKAR
jgi:hypothetical protein